MTKIDADATLALAEALMKAVSVHLRTRPQAQNSNYEVLNALAFALAPVMAGARLTEQEKEAREFFELALERQVAEFLKLRDPQETRH